MTDHIKLKRKIVEADMTQREFANRLGFSEQYVSRLCNNDTNQMEDSLKKMASVLDCKIDDIV